MGDGRWVMGVHVCLVSLLTIAVATSVFAQTANRVEVIRRDADRRVDVLVGGKPFTSYIYPTTIKKPVLYPLRTASGTAVTRGYPLDPRPGERVDHPHHVGLWFSYGDVNGLDFWNNSDAIPAKNAPKMGTTVHRAIRKVESGDGQGALEVTGEWVTHDGKALLREDTRFVFYSGSGRRAVDRITTLTALKDTVRLTDNKEGVIGMRVARGLEQPSTTAEVFTDASGKATSVPVLDNTGVTGRYRSSEGLEGDSVWGTRARWTMLTGDVQKEPVTLAILDHPSNVGFPTYWHARGYGLFAANPLGQKALSNGKDELNFKLAPGASTTFRHRILILSGKATPDVLEKEYTAFAGTSATRAATSPSADSAAIAALEVRIERAVVEYDAKFLETVYAPTFRFKHSTGNVETREQRMKSMSSPPAAGATRVTARDVDSLEVEVHGDVALTTGRIHVRRNGPPSPNRDYTIRYARIYVRGPTGWQLVTHHSTQQTFDPSAP
jgi:ketosteroid isomerase-like protein